MFENHFRRFARNARVVGGLAVLAIAIAIAGLIAMALHASLARRKEIGVRKTLGATVAQIVLMLLRDFSRPILLAGAIAWPVAYVAAQKYLGVFVQSVELGWMPFIVSFVVVLTVSWTALAAQAVSAARIRPASVLHCE